MVSSISKIGCLMLHYCILSFMLYQCCYWSFYQFHYC